MGKRQITQRDKEVLLVKVFGLSTTNKILKILLKREQKNEPPEIPTWEMIEMFGL